MEFLTGVAVGAIGLAAWRTVSESAEKGGVAAARAARGTAGAVTQRVTGMVDRVRGAQDAPPEPQSNDEPVEPLAAPAS